MLIVIQKRMVQKLVDIIEENKTQTTMTNFN